MNSLDIFGRIEIIKAHVLKEFLIKKIEKLDIVDLLTMMYLKGDDFFHCNLSVKSGIASFFSVYEEITNLVEIYDLSKSHDQQKHINKTYLEIVSIYQNRLNGQPINIETFGKIKPYLQLKNLILLGDLSMNINGFFVYDDENYKKIVENVVNKHKNDHIDKIDQMLRKLKNEDNSY